MTESDEIGRNSMIRWAALSLIFLVTPALADDKPAPKDVAAIEQCITTKTGANWAWEQCIGIIGNKCAEHEERMSPADVIECYAREQLVWDDILNKSFQALRKALDDEQVKKMQQMQRAWIASRDKTCGFIYDYFQGTMANPMMAACHARATGLQALFLRSFADDAAQRK